LVAVGAYDVAGAEDLAVGVDKAAGAWMEAAGAGLRDALDGVLPMEADAEAGGAVEQELVENGAADAASGAGREGSLGGGGVCGRHLVVEESNAAEGSGFDLAEVFVEVEAEGSERGEGVGHEAFAAGFVDAGLHSVDDLDLEALIGGGDGAGQTGRSCTYDENINRIQMSNGSSCACVQ
jgi:hypothetical protein